MRINNKGQGRPAFLTLIFTIVAIIGIFILFAFGVKLFAFFTSITDLSYGGFATFEAVKESVPLLLNSSESSCFFKFFIDEGAVFVGWSQGVDIATRKDEGFLGIDALDLDEAINRNPNCPKDRSCMAMCNVGKGKFLNSNDGAQEDDCIENVFAKGAKNLIYSLPKEVKQIKLNYDNKKDQSLMIFGTEYKLINMLITKTPDKSKITFTPNPKDLTGFEACGNLQKVPTEKLITPQISKKNEEKRTSN